MLKIRNLNVWSGNCELIDNFSLNLNIGEIHALMGPNGSGKTSLALGIMGHRLYKIKKGNILIGNKNITNLNPTRKAKLGLFLSFQNPPSVSGVSLISYLREAEKSIVGTDNFNFNAFYKKLIGNLRLIKMEESFLDRSLNDAFSGGEKKKAEMLSLLTLNPKYLILDEIDSGLDMDAINILSKIIRKIKKETGIIIITHQRKILDFIKPDFVHILKKGRIVASGNSDLLDSLERSGYGEFN